MPDTEIAGALFISATQPAQASDGMLWFDSVNKLWKRGDGAAYALVAPGIGTSANIAFTDGDTCRRVTITNANVTASSVIIGTIRRPNVTDANDRGYLYTTNIVSVGSGSFDLLIACTAWGFDDPTLKPPSETVQFYYQVS